MAWKNLIYENYVKTYEIQDPTCLIYYWVLKIFLTSQTESYSENCEKFNLIEPSQTILEV